MVLWYIFTIFQSVMLFLFYLTLSYHILFNTFKKIGGKMINPKKPEYNYWD